MTLTPPLKWFGGKHYLAPKLAKYVPVHIHYVEPYAGGLALLLHLDPTGRSEVVNDLDGALTNFWSVLRHEALFPEFLRACQATPFSEIFWQQAAELCEQVAADPTLSVNPTYSLGWAYYFFIYCRQSRGGQFTSFATLSRTRTRGNMNEQASAWWNCVDGLAEVHDRLARVVILNDDALKVIAQQDGKDTFYYLDPPYLHSERVAGGYSHEMSEQQHVDLLNTLLRISGKCMLSGYPSELYDKLLRGWRRIVIETPNHASAAAFKERKSESIWMNY